MIEVFADGGVIAKNPSPHGGTWAWRLLYDGMLVAFESGVLTNRENGQPVTNNVTELLALLKGIGAVYTHLAIGGYPEYTVYSDSKVSLLRVFRAAPLNGVPPRLIVMLQDQIERGLHRNAKHVLLDGHPTKTQLAAGIGKRGNPVHAEQVACDEMCTTRARAYIAGLS